MDPFLAGQPGQGKGMEADVMDTNPTAEGAFQDMAATLADADLDATCA